MSARHRRRRRAAPRRKLRRWYRRQDRLTRVLLFAVIALGALVAALMVPLQDRERPGHQASRAAATRPEARKPASQPVAAGARSAARPRRETPATAKVPPPRQPARTEATPRAAGATPLAAIVIDDLGRRISHFERLAAVGIPLTIAVIPGLPATAATVREASRLGIEMILHQPMEPREEGGKDAGAGVLLTSMGGDELRARLREGLAAVPGAVGVNNHMGSRFTEDHSGLAALMTELGERGLFWLDSRTTPATRGAEIARGAGVPALERDVFLDAEVDPAFIRAQVRRLVVIARARGRAIGIGHPHPETIAALEELREELLGSGVTLVPVSALLPGAGGSAATLASDRPAGKGREPRTAAASP